MSDGRLIIVSDFDDVMCNTVINWGIENNIPLETLQHREFWSVDKSLGQELGTYVGGIDYSNMKLNMVGELLWKYHQKGVIDLYIISATTGNHADKDEAKMELMRKSMCPEFVKERVLIVPATKSKGEAIKEKWGLDYIDIFVDDKHENHLDVVKSLVCGFNMAPRFGFSTVSLEPYVRFYHPPIVNEEKGKVDFARVLLGCITNKCAMITPIVMEGENRNV